MICPRCGTDNPNNANFCCKCAYNLKTANPNNLSSSKELKMPGFKTFFAFFIISTTIIGILYKLFGPPQVILGVILFAVIFGFPFTIIEYVIRVLYVHLKNRKQKRSIATNKSVVSESVSNTQKITPISPKSQILTANINNVSPQEPLNNVKTTNSQAYIMRSISATLTSSEPPQETLNAMRATYTQSQIMGDMKIIDDSLAIMSRTSDIDTFISRYNIAMQHILNLEQAKKAGLPVAISNDFSQSFANRHSKALSEVLYRSLKKELSEIALLKTAKGKLNRINKYQNKLRDMYEDNFEFVVDETYSDIMEKLDSLKSSLE